MTTPEQDLVSRLLALFDTFVDTLHDKVIRPIIIAARIVAFGFIALVLAAAIAVVLLIAILRFVDIYFSASHVWIAYYIVGAVFLLGGFVTWHFRRPGKLRT